MHDLRTRLIKETFGAQSVPAIEISTFSRQWDKQTFFSKEINGLTTTEFNSTAAGEFLEQQFLIAAGLAEIGIEHGSHVGVYSLNSLRCAVEIFATLSLGAVYVPLYPTLTMEEAHLLLEHSQTGIMFVGDVSQYQKAVTILDRVRSPLSRIIVNFPTDKKHRNVMSYEELLALGKKTSHLDRIIDSVKTISGDDLAAIIYTPGTTGVPKGVMLTHGNFLAQIPVTEHFDINSDDIRLSHLPFSHVFGLSADLFASALIGTPMAISHTFDTEEITRDIAAIKPTVMCSVPRMYEKLYVHTVNTINRSKPPKRWIYELAISVGKAHYARKKTGRRIPFFLSLIKSSLCPVYHLIRKSINMNRTKVLFSGGGPLSLEVSHFYGSIDVRLLEGYGLTETSPIVNVNRPGSNRPGTVGPPITGVEERISDEGEILIRGDMVFKGYYRDDGQNMEEAFTPDGFFRTGDVGVLDEDGTLTITSRLKDLIITSAGKNIAPQRIERLFDNDEYIDYFCVVGDKRKYLTALVVPNFNELEKLAKNYNIRYDSPSDLVKNEKIRTLYKERIDSINETLARYEQIKKFTLLDHPFSVESGELTMAYKFKRRFIQDQYKDVIDMMYPRSDTHETD